MPWHAQLQLNYSLEAQRTVLRHHHDGPLRTLKSLYPEGAAICHNIIVHPPGGLVGGDVLDVRVHAQAGSHALLSTPGATRFYASDGDIATQQVALTLEAGSRLEWLPLEAIAYPGCMASNQWEADLAPGAELLAWDVTALGLPASGKPFDQGRLHQRMAIAGLWLEQSRIDAADLRLLESPLGMARQRCIGTMLFATGTPLHRDRREHLLDTVRSTLAQANTGVQLGVTSPHPQVLVLRALAPLVEPVMTQFQKVWLALRSAAWGLDSAAPRIWAV